MIENLISLLSQGFKQIRLNTNYLLVAVLVIVLPVLFVWLSQNFFEVAYENVNTSEKQNVDMLHDVVTNFITTSIDEAGINSSLENIVSEQSKITKIRILSDSQEGLTIIFSSDDQELGVIEGGNQLYATAATVPGDSLIFDFTIDGARTWQAFRQIKIEDNTLYIFSEHNFREIDTIMLARQQQLYLGLPIVFLFLLSLAYWVLRQTQWQREYQVLRKKMDEQMMFTNTIAHELRAPLTAIRGYVSFLQESTNLSTKEQEYASNIHRSGERLLALISDFLEVARIQAGKLKMKFKDVDVRTILEAASTEMRATATNKGLELRLDNPNKPVIAHTDSDRLQQVLVNLLSNAIKYTKEGSVTLSLKQTRFKTIVTIKDTGDGISAEDQQKLFGAFTRVGNADSGSETGTGLGMWITKQLVELLHGEIYVESIEGIGTHVKMTFDV